MKICFYSHTYNIYYICISMRGKGKLCFNGIIKQEMVFALPLILYLFPTPPSPFYLSLLLSLPFSLFLSLSLTAFMHIKGSRGGRILLEVFKGREKGGLLDTVPRIRFKINKQSRFLINYNGAFTRYKAHPFVLGLVMGLNLGPTPCCN